jgi:hypothetical protein
MHIYTSLYLTSLDLTKPLSCIRLAAHELLQDREPGFKQRGLWRQQFPGVR